MIVAARGMADGGSFVNKHEIYWSHDRFLAAGFGCRGTQAGDVISLPPERKRTEKA